MKYIVVGLGSMGKRRIRLLRTILKEGEIVGVDTNLDRLAQVREEFGITTNSDLKSVVAKGDALFVCTSPLAHASLITQGLEAGCHIFTELNLSSQDYQKNIDLAVKNHCVLFLSSTFLYRREIQYLKEHIMESQNAYTYHVGQYLPDWHPWESYHNFFVADKRTNGCRELLAIELPWLVDTFGKIENAHVLRSKKSQFDLPYDDTYQLLIQHERGNSGVVTIDLISRKAIRTLEVMHEDYHYFWGGTPTSFTKYNLENKKIENIECYSSFENNPLYSENIVENAYTDEILAFLEQIQTGTPARYSFEKDAEILKLIDKIEEVA